MDDRLPDRIRFLHMRDAAKDALSYLINRSRADLDADSMLLRALVQCLQVIGEAAARTSDEGRARAPALPWPKMVGMRHILIHVYYDIDADTVWRVAHQDLLTLLVEVERVIAAWPAQP